MKIEARELEDYAEPINPDLLQEGEIYLSVQYADEAMLIPIVETWVFAGKYLKENDSAGQLYFQDVESYLQGIRYESATEQNSVFQVATPPNINHIFTFKKAVEELLKCQLRRSHT